MNKKTLSLTLTSALASLMSAAPAIQASENPFSMSSIYPNQQLAQADNKSAEAGCSAKMKEGKCGEGKCGASKTQDMKGTEGGCNAKMPEGGCSGKMPEGGCNGSVAK